MFCHLKLENNIELKRGEEVILTWKKSQDENNMSTKPEYIKILKDGKYEINYSIRWHAGNTKITQPLKATLYKVTKDFELVVLHAQVTVCVNGKVNLSKSFPFDLKRGERICIGVANLSYHNFYITTSEKEPTQITAREVAQ